MDTSQIPASTGYSYDMGFGASSGPGIASPYDTVPSATMETEQNYGYNYTPDSKYYNGFNYSGKASMSSAGAIKGPMQMSGGSETMNQYYAQNDVMNSNMYMGNSQ